MVFVPAAAVHAQTDGTVQQALGAGRPGAPGSSGPVRKGGGGMGAVGGPSPSDVTTMHRGDGERASPGDMVSAAATGETGGGTENTQDGDHCDQLTNVGIGGPLATFPGGMPTAANYSRIGAQPYDLGAMIRGGASVPTPGYDDGAFLQAQALLSTPFAHPLGYGASFAVGSGGTVSPSTGAFLHPFTLLSLPSYAARMGLLLQMEYMSNVQHPAVDPLPFGEGFVLSGHDFLVETSGLQEMVGAEGLVLFRGDGHEARYQRVSGNNPWVYSSSAGAQDKLTASYDTNSQTLSYVRTLRDGRAITYQRLAAFGASGGSTCTRRRVTDPYGNQITYAWTTVGGLGQLDWITDTRGLTVDFAWDSGTPNRVVRITLSLSGLVVAPPQADGANAAQTDFEIDFAYDTNRRLQKIQWWKTSVIADSNADGRLAVGEATVLRPRVELEYEGHGKLAKLWDTTITTAPVLQLEVEYDSDEDWGVRVVSEVEAPASAASTHLFEYPTATSRTYLDPRGRETELTLDTGEFRVTTVKMFTGSMTPRDADSFTGDHVDYDDLTWSIGYTCCGLPSSIVEPSGRTFAFAWDDNSLQQVWLGGNSLHRLEVDDFGRVLRWWPGAYGVNIDPRLTVTYSPATSLPATGISLETLNYIDPRTTSTGLGKSTATLTIDSNTGRLTGSTHPGGGSSTFAYNGSTVSGRHLLQSITGPAAGASLKATFACDDLGRPTSVVRGLAGGERTTTLGVDSLGRVRWVKAKAFATGPDLASEAWHDRFGAVALARRENRGPDGTARSRPWLQAETLRDPLGRVVRTVRDGAPVTATTEVALVTLTTWHDDHRVDTVTAPNSGITTYVWDGYGLLYKTLVQASSSTTLTPRRLFYTEDGQVRFVRNDLGDELVIDRFSATGLVQKVHDPAGLHRLEFAYDGSMRLHDIQVWGQTGGWHLIRQTAIEYDELDRVKKVSTGLTSLDSQRIHVFDLGGRLVEVGLQETRSDSDFLRGFKRAFDTYGRLLWQRDRLSDTTDQWNQVSFTYDAYSGLPTKMTEREIEQVAGQFGVLSGTGHTARLYETLLTHDLLDRVVQVERKPENGQSGSSVVHHYHHDSLGDLVRFVDAIGAELRWEFDALGNLRKRTEKGTSGGEIDNTTLIDFATGLVTRTDSENKVSRFRFDRAWRLESQEFPGYSSSSPAFSHTFSYDAASRLTQIVNGNGVSIQRSYDASGRMLAQWVSSSLNGHSEWATKEIFAYDDFGGLGALTTMAGTTFATHVVKVTQPQDEYGRTKWERFDFLGNGVADLNVTSDYGSGGSEDLLTRRGLTVEGVGSITFQLDRLGRTWGYGAGGSTDEFIARYRFVGGRVRERQQGKQASQAAWLLSTDHGWDPLRRLASLETKDIAASTVHSRFDHTYDIEGHLLKRKRDRVGVGSGGGDWFKLDEYYRLAGTKLGVDPSQFGTTHSNSAFDAISTFQRGIEYSPSSAPLDEAQNRHLVKETVGSTTTDTAYTVTDHRYTNVGGATLTYDGEGNLVSDGLRFFVYDFKNRLSEVWMYAPAEGEQAMVQASASRDGRARYAVPVERLQRIRARARSTLLSADRMRRGYADVTGRARFANQDQGLAAAEGNLELVAFYGYDAFNRRVIRYLVGQLGRYSTWDGWREVAEHVWGGSSWVAVASYVWGGRIDELIRYSKWTGSAWQHFHPQQDHQDSVDLLVGADGVPKEKYEYDPFGGVTVFTWNGSAWTNPTNGSPLGNPYTYTGRRLDGETGLLYYRNRYYSPSLGRFVTGDPIGLWGDVHGVGNGYMYAGNSPAFLGDPFGLQVGGEQSVNIPGHGAFVFNKPGETPLPTDDGTYRVILKSEDGARLGSVTIDIRNGAIENPRDFLGPDGEANLRLAVDILRAAGDALDAIQMAGAVRTAVRGLQSAGEKLLACAKNFVKPSSRALGRALKKAGQTQSPGSVAHHIVAGKSRMADPAREALERFGIGINDAENGVFLAKRFHEGLHTNAYYETVNKALASATSRDQAIEALRAIAKRLAGQSGQ